jgi:single-strand DNA-binding protein
MAKDMNKIWLIGRLTKDPELKYTQGGTPVASISIANNYVYTTNGEKKEKVSFFNIVSWGKAGEVIAQDAKKGSKLAITGRLDQRSWQAQDGTKKYAVDIILEEFQFLDTKRPDEQPEKSGLGTVVTDGSIDSFENQAQHFSDSDVPF